MALSENTIPVMDDMPGSGLRAAIYTRMSLARMDDQTKVADQERICREYAGRRGIDIIDAYCDNNKSAWDRGRKRPGWESLLGDIDSGRINCVVLYHGDRLIRQPWDLELIIQRAESKGIRILSPTGERSLDSADDRFILRIEAAQACRESDNISRRQKARYERDRRAGKVMAQGPGGRRFGYRSDGVTLQPADRCVVATRAEESEADVIREMCRRTLAGESANSIEADLRARGWTTPAGKLIRHMALKRWLANPRYAGLMPDGETAAAWPAILKREDWERARLVLDARGAQHPKGERAARWLLSGIATCSRCQGLMGIRYATSRGYRSALYSCERREGGCGKTWRNAEHLDAYVSAAVVAYQADERHPAAAAEALPGMAAEWQALASERAETEELLASYTGSAGRSRLLLRRLDAIDERIAVLRELADTSQRDRLASQYRGITLEEFRALPLDVQRALVRATVTVTVLPASRRGPGFRTEDVRVLPVS